MSLSELCFSQNELAKIFSFETPESDRLISRENGRLEFKEAFNLGSVDEYAKTAAAFANAAGGYIVFGVRDSPRQLVGLRSNNFETFDAARLTGALNDRFSPELHWEHHVTIERNLKIGIIYFAEARQKPVVCTRTGGCLQQGAIYYRYRGRSEAIRFSELRRMLDDEKARERNLWMKQLRRISEAGVEQVAVLNLQSGEVSGAHGKFYISDDLLPKLQFIREGLFVETEGAPALRLLGDLQPAEAPVINATVQVPAPVHEFEIISAFLHRVSVLSPTEYLKAICFEPSHFLPIYFFIQQTNEMIGEIVDLLTGLRVRGNTRDKLVARLQNTHENLTISSLSGASAATVERREILNEIRVKTLTPETIAGKPVRFFEALTHTNAADFDQDYIFRLLVDYVLPKLSELTSIDRTHFRKALCHLDNMWFKSASL